MASEARVGVTFLTTDWAVKCSCMGNKRLRLCWHHNRYSRLRFSKECRSLDSRKFHTLKRKHVKLRLANSSQRHANSFRKTRHIPQYPTLIPILLSHIMPVTHSSKTKPTTPHKQMTSRKTGITNKKHQHNALANNNGTSAPTKNVESSDTLAPENEQKGQQQTGMMPTDDGCDDNIEEHPTTKPGACKRNQKPSNDSDDDENVPANEQE